MQGFRDTTALYDSRNVFSLTIPRRSLNKHMQKLFKKAKTNNNNIEDIS